MKNRTHICLSPHHEETVKEWAADGYRSFSAQISLLVQEEINRQKDAREAFDSCSVHESDNGKEARAE